MKNLQIFNYKGSPITFRQGYYPMVNATQMASVFGKKPAHWLRNNFARELINNYAELHRCPPFHLVQVTNGEGGCTWMHIDIAMWFSRWVNTDLTFWYIDKVKGLSINFQSMDTNKNKITESSEELIEQGRKIEELTNRVNKLESSSGSGTHYLTIREYFKSKGVNLNIKSSMTFSELATTKCLIHGHPMKFTGGDVFEKEQLFPDFVLDQVYDEPISTPE